uniref:Uncharacterized protein n=1 Tax=Anguilla anguilla TaxID=7936 RepID=A0A0E9TQ13_ANGAN
MVCFHLTSPCHHQDYIMYLQSFIRGLRV